VLPKILAVPALVALGTLPCQANHQVFSVQNLTRVPWDLVEETPGKPGNGPRLEVLHRGKPRIARGKARFTVEPGATLTFLAETGPRSVGYLTLNLQSGPGSARLPVPGARVHLPVPYGSWEEACAPGWEPFEMNAFVIRDDGSVVIRYMKDIGSPAPPQEPDQEPPKALPRSRPIRRAKRVLGGERKAQPGHALPLTPLPSPMDVLPEDPPAERTSPDATKTECSLFLPLTPLASPLGVPWEDPAGGGCPLPPLPEERKTGPSPDLHVALAISPVEALREDLAGSAMFLGNDEGQHLAASLGLTMDVHIPIGERKDGEGRVVVGARSRFGPPGPLAARRDGLILLSMGRHYTVLRPASPAEKGLFVLEDGAPYQEVTRTVAAPGGGLRQVPMIPSDGHCLIGALHYLHFGSPASPDQVGAHRRLVAGRMSVEALNTLAAELADEVLAGVYPILPNGCFPTLGPAFSRSLQASSHFMEVYNWAVTLQQKDLMAFFGQASHPEAGEPGR